MIQDRRHFDGIANDEGLLNVGHWESIVVEKWVDAGAAALRCIELAAVDVACVLVPVEDRLFDHGAVRRARRHDLVRLNGNAALPAGPRNRVERGQLVPAGADFELLRLRGRTVLVCERATDIGSRGLDAKHVLVHEVRHGQLHLLPRSLRSIEEVLRVLARASVSTLACDVLSMVRDRIWLRRPVRLRQRLHSHFGLHVAEEGVHVVLLQVPGRRRVVVRGVERDGAAVQVESLWDERDEVRGYLGHHIGSVVQVPRCVLPIILKHAELLAIAQWASTVAVNAWRVVVQSDAIVWGKIPEILQALLPNEL